ncbi:hypothetical protein [Hymenobacter psychrophilus]|uniref:DUF4175 domain-containing protein n=1 Tax=Hymenobacter psychrophilus TaxID=651662 RepID=A0A1H3JFF3_9BACT|nr:hypothetical protein [Hymenobacter psychrophilus]SDY38760.1 hypothetical protein SAMN04488069_10859 [Hymenobacter psychrophilus]
MSPAVAPAATKAPAPAGLVQAAGQGRARRRTLALLLPALAAAGLLLTVAKAWPGAGYFVAGVALALMGLAAWALWRIWHEPADATARRLNRQHPALEDSTALLLRPAADLNLLEQLQQQRLIERLPKLAATGPLLPVNFRPALGGAAVLLLLAALAWWQRPGPAAVAAAAGAPVALRFHETPAQPAAAPRIVETRLRLQPPAYTRQPAFTPAAGSFRCPAGSRVRWQVRLSRPSKTPPVLELGTRKLPLQPVPGDSLAFGREESLVASALYRLRLGGQVSDDYSIEVVADQAPVIRLLQPKAYTLVEFGQPPRVAIEAQLKDDYGLSRARLVATVAQGQGEAVKFTEVVTELSTGLGGQPTSATLRPVLNLPALGLSYGDEVYFYLQAWDNHQQLTRSDTYLVQWEDTTVQNSTLDASLGVNTAPAYFRSQRQIIIDTEKLLAERSRLPAATVQERANSIGVDQKLLRMRYGKFLGEETDESIGGATRPDERDEATRPAEPPGMGSVVAEDHTAPEPASPEPAASAAEHHEGDGHDHSSGVPARAGQSAAEARTAELMEPYMHRHDDAETADFLEPAVKAKLQAVLAQMWESELRLRTGQLREALPFEYRALRLLKEVQQQTRAYVKKAGFTPPPMPEATTRLTGDLAGASAPRRQRQLDAPPQQPALRAALATVRQLRASVPVPAGAAAALEQAGPALSRAALQTPGRYLAALRNLRDVTAAIRAGQPVDKVQLLPLERAFTDLLPVPPPAPAARPAPGTQLARRYFDLLN